jgi:hypothetical protein
VNGRHHHFGTQMPSGGVHPINALLLGIQGVRAGFSELSASFSLALEQGAQLEDIAATIQAHTSLGEAQMESAYQAWAIHYIFDQPAVDTLERRTFLSLDDPMPQAGA